MSLLWRLYTESILRLADRRFSNLSPPRSECEESVIHRRLILALFLPAVPCIRFISNMYLAFGLAFVLTILVAFGTLSFITPKLEKEEKLKEQIVRYDESWLASNINEALYKSVLTPELLTYIVDDIKIKSVENTEDTTTISVSAKLRRTILEMISILS